MIEGKLGKDAIRFVIYQRNEGYNRTSVQRGLNFAAKVATGDFEVERSPPCSVDPSPSTVDAVSRALALTDIANRRYSFSPSERNVGSSRPRYFIRD